MNVPQSYKSLLSFAVQSAHSQDKAQSSKHLFFQNDSQSFTDRISNCGGNGDSGGSYFSFTYASCENVGGGFKFFFTKRQIRRP